MAKENRILFVEGADDQHTIWAICEHFKIEETFTIEIPDRTGKINRRAKSTELGGIDNVLKATRLNLTAGSGAVERLGVVIDADQDLNSQWQKIISILTNAGYTNLPALPNSDGTIVKQDFLPAFGVWIMPDNVITRGMLEDFLEFLVPDKDTNQLWTKAVESSRQVLNEIEEEKRFSEIHFSKAKIHTYLAWQKDCGTSFGLSITKNTCKPTLPNVGIL